MSAYWPFAGLVRHGGLRERLIVPLDLVDRAEALKLVDRLARVVGMFKVGRGLFLGGGPEFVREVRRRGGEVFLDLRFRDSPQGVLRAALEATRLGVKMFDVQAARCPVMIARTRLEVSRLCRAEGLRRPHILAVAMLAKLDAQGASPAAKPQGTQVDRVAQLARVAADAALDGVFTSASEAQRIRAACGRRFIIVACGVRPREVWQSDGFGMSAVDAIRAGADYLVVGGPVWRASEPQSVVRDLSDAIERGLRSSYRPAALDHPAGR